MVSLIYATKNDYIDEVTNLNAFTIWHFLTRQSVEKIGVNRQILISTYCPRQGENERSVGISQLKQVTFLSITQTPDCRGDWIWNCVFVSLLFPIIILFDSIKLFCEKRENQYIYHGIFKEFNIQLLGQFTNDEGVFL